jgi:hypothetical protein
MEEINWAKYSKDGNYYLATIINNTENAVTVRFFDGFEENVNKENVISIEGLTKTKLIPFGNYANEGTYYQCKILQIKNDSVEVKYTQDNVIELIPFEQLIFKSSTNKANKAKGRILLPIAGILAITASVFAFLITLDFVSGDIIFFKDYSILAGAVFGLASLVGGVFGIINCNKTGKSAMLIISWSAYIAVLFMIGLAILSPLDYIRCFLLVIPSGLLWFGAVLNNEESI